MEKELIAYYQWFDQHYLLTAYLLHLLFLRPIEGGTASCKQKVDILLVI